MKRTLLFAAVISALLAVVAVGCQSGDRGGEEVEIRPAPIHESQVNIVESDPPQVFVHIKAGLPDACTNFHEIKTERYDNTIDITVTIERLKDKICAQVYTYFGGYVELGSDFTSGERYTINVNDKMTTFVMP